MSDGVYLDHAATSFPKAPGVASAIAGFLEREAGNPGRGGHRLSVAAARAVEETRTTVAGLLGASVERTLFGPGATFWINAVLAGVVPPVGRVVTSALEHNAVMRPLRALADRHGVEVQVVAGAAPSGVPRPEEFVEATAAGGCDLVVVTHASNVSGAVLPVAEIARAVAPVPVLVDGAQAAGSVPFRFDQLGVAAYACSAHKGLLGPQGVGLLLLGEGFEPPPPVRGGTGSRSDSDEMPEALPDRLEAGTPNVPGIVGLGAAARWLTAQGIAATADRVAGLRRRLREGLAGRAGVRLHGEHDATTGTLSFTVARADAGELAAWLDRRHGIMLRVGLHCAPAAHRRLGTFPAGTLRVGLGPFNREQDVDMLLAALDEWRNG